MNRSRNWLQQHLGVGEKVVGIRHELEEFELVLVVAAHVDRGGAARAVGRGGRGVAPGDGGQRGGGGGRRVIEGGIDRRRECRRGRDVSRGLAGDELQGANDVQIAAGPVLSGVALSQYHAGRGLLVVHTGRTAHTGPRHRAGGHHVMLVVVLVMLVMMDGVRREGRRCCGHGQVQLIPGRAYGEERRRLRRGREGDVRQGRASGVVGRLWGERGGRVQLEGVHRRVVVCLRETAHVEVTALVAAGGILWLDESVAESFGGSRYEGAVQVAGEVVDTVLMVLVVWEVATLELLCRVMEGGKEVPVGGGGGGVREWGGVRGGGKDESRIILARVDVGMVLQGKRRREGSELSTA